MSYYNNFAMLTSSLVHIQSVLLQSQSHLHLTKNYVWHKKSFKPLKMDKWGVAQWFISSKFFSEIMFFCSTPLLTVASMSFAEKQRQWYSPDMKSNLMFLGYLATSNQQILIC